MKRLVPISIVTALLLLLAAAPTQDDSAALEQTVFDLKMKVAGLQTRVARLEQAVGGYRGSSGAQQGTDTGAALPVTGPTMVVDSITISDHVTDNTAKIEKLQRDIDSLQQTVDQEAEKLARINSQNSSGYSGGGRSESAERNRRAAAQQSLVSRYRNQLAAKRRELDRLERAAAEQKQIIHGHDGDLILLLDTESDLSQVLDTVSLGDTITWTGRRMSATDGSETWTVRSVTRVEAAGE